MNKMTLIRAFGGVALLVLGVREYHKQKVAEDPDAHYLLGGVDDVAVGKSNHRVRKVEPENPGILKTIEGDERPVLTADSFRNLPKEIVQFKTELSELIALFDNHQSKREDIVPKNYSKLSLNQIREIIENKIEESKMINDKRLPHLEHLMKTSETYEKHFQILERVLNDIENRIGIVRDYPQDVKKDTGLTQTEIEGILEDVNPMPIRIQTSQFTPEP